MPAAPHPVEIWTLTLCNLGRRPRRLSVFALAELSLLTDVSLYGHASYLHGIKLARSHGVAARKVAMNLPNPYYSAIFLSSRRPTSWEANLNAFKGQFRTLANPIALARGRCCGGISSRDPVGAVLHFQLRLAPGASPRTDFLVGAADVFKVEAEASRYVRNYLQSGSLADDHFARMRGTDEVDVLRRGRWERQ